MRLPCDFQGEAIKVIWNKEEGRDAIKSLQTVLKYDSDSFIVSGDSRYGWSFDFSLVLRDLVVTDEGNFTCQVWKKNEIELKNFTLLNINGKT